MKYTDLELTQDAMKQMGELALDAVIEHILGLPDAPRSELKDSVLKSRSLREPPPETGTDFPKLLDLLMNQVIPVSINAPHPSYLGYIPGGGLYPSAVADFISSAVNRFTGIWLAAPAAVRLEANVLEWFAEWMGYPESTRGILTSGGSLANFSAIVTARKHLLGDDISRGVIYASDQTHHSMMKVAMLAGIREENIRLLETDEAYRAVPEKFEKAITTDQKRGLKPFLLVSNAGTTNTGAVDPLNNMSEIARRFELWHHIDAAYGGFFNLCDKGRKKLSGIENSDSLILDPHKGLFVPYGTGSLLVKEGELLRKAHMLTADYLQDLPTPEGEVDPSLYSPELSRPYRGLRVWLPLKLYGIKAFRENIAEKLELTQWIYRRFCEEQGFECISPPDLSVIAFRYIPERGDADLFNRRLQKAINDSQKLFLSSTLLRGEFVIRVCVLSFRTHKSEIEEAFDIIKFFAKQQDKE